MNHFDWLSEYLAQLQDEHVLVRKGSAQRLAPAHVLEIDYEDWRRSARIAKANDYRFVSCWGDQQQDDIVIFAMFEFNGDYLVLQTCCDIKMPLINSITRFYPAANRAERHLQDMLGIVFVDHPDERRWTRHQAWKEGEYPLRSDFGLQGSPEEITPADGSYPFEKVAGDAVYEIPVGPVHAGIIEPGHFRFSAVGEKIVSLEEHLGYMHRGIEKQAVGKTPEQLAKLAARVSGDSTVAYSWASCQAMERAAKMKIPRRAVELRAIMAERERVANHLGDIGAICNDVGFAFAFAQMSRLREQWQRRSDEVFGHRFMMDCIVPGGVNVDIDKAIIAKLKQDNELFLQECKQIFDIFLDQPSLEDRLLSAGVLTTETARHYACTGYVGKASGLGFDVRNTVNYSPYKQSPLKPFVLDDGDVMARVQIRMSEVEQSLRLMTDLLNHLASGAIQNPFPQAGASEGISMVEGFRGEIVVYVRFDEEGKIARYFPRDPSWQTWPALQKIVLNNIVADFPVCNKSVNGSYAGHDL